MADDEALKRAVLAAKRAFARDQYENKFTKPVIPNIDDQPRSARWLIWYGWKDITPEPYFPRFIARAYTFQCANINPKNQHRCEREVCLGSQYCAQHLELLGIEVHMKYKYGGSSDVVDYVEKVTVLRDFPKDSIILKLYGEMLNMKEHLKRYQKKNKCGPHELGFRERNRDRYIYIDLCRSSNEAGYLPVRADTGNLYIDLDNISFDFKWDPKNIAFNLKALRDLKMNDELIINPKSKNYYYLPTATPAEAFFLIIFLVIMGYLKNI